MCECVLRVCLYAFSFLLVSILMSFLSEFSLILDGLELHFWFIWCSGGSQALPWGASGSPWALNLDGFKLHFWFISALEAPWASSGALWGPLERQGGPKRGPMSEKWFVGPPLGSQPGVIFS